MTQEREKRITFARPMTISIGMETITLSYEPGSDFAKKLDDNDYSFVTPRPRLASQSVFQNRKRSM